MKTSIVKSAEIRNLHTGVDFIFKVEEWKTAGGGRLYSFRIENDYGETLYNGSWLLCKAEMDELKFLFDWGERDG